MYALVVGSQGALIGTSGNLVISLVAAGLVVVLFQPLRALVQGSVNRLLYGQRDEPYSVITQLSQRLEKTLAPYLLCGHQASFCQKKMPSVFPHS